MADPLTDTRGWLPWPVRSVLAGTAGTAAMTLAYATERAVRGRVRPDVENPLDYDDSLVPGKIVAALLRRSGASDRTDEELGLALRWSYGSVFGLLHGMLRRRVGEPWAGAGFAGTLLTITLTAFPLLGHTPPPWRWPKGYLATACATHVVYAGTVAGVDDRLRLKARTETGETDR